MPLDVSPAQNHTPSFNKASRRSTIVIWIIAILIGVGLAMTRIPSVFVDGDVHPLGNDAFYHASRMLDVAEDPSSTHSFDQNLHWPEGHWITWPWAYDYLGGVIARALSSDRSGAARIMVFYPLLWLIGSITLVGLIAREILRPGMAAICMFAYAAAPLTLFLFSVGALDHHSSEHFWFLMSMYLTGIWLKFPDSRKIPIALGIVLAASTAFHNSLFLLQIPVLAALFIARFSKHTLPSTRQSILFGFSLLATQLLVLLPSHFFITFEYVLYFHSWFHLHVALLTSVGVFALCCRRDLIMWSMLFLAALLALPTSTQVMYGMNYIQSDIPLFDALQETKPMFGGSMSLRQINFFFTSLVWLLPINVGYAVFLLFKRRAQNMTLVVLVTSLFGFAVMLAHFRFQYFGYLFLVIIPLLMIQQLLPKGRKILVAGALVIGTYMFSLGIYVIPAQLGDSPRYAWGLPLIQTAQLQCEKHPGLLLVDPNWGSLLRYRTNCPILTNNFVLTPKEVDYVELTIKLLQQTPGQLRVLAPDVRYIIVSEVDLYPLSASLLSDDVFDGFEVVEELRDFAGKVTGRFYRVDPLLKTPFIK